MSRHRTGVRKLIQTSLQGAFLLAVLVTLTGVATGTEYSPEVQFRLKGSPPEVVAGQSVELEFEVFAKSDIELQDLGLAGKGWAPVPHSQSKSIHLTHGRETTVSFTVTPDGNWDDLNLEYKLDGIQHSLRLGLAPAEVRKARMGGTTRAIETTTFVDGGYFPVTDEPGTKMLPTPPEKLGLVTATGGSVPEIPADSAAGLVDISGVLGYMRNGRYYRVYGASVFVDLPNIINYVPLGSTTTNRDGSFSLTTTIAIPDGTALILKFYASNSAMSVTDDGYIYEDTYYWSSPSQTVVNGSADWGNQGAEGHVGALNIISATSRANSYLLSNAGIASLPDVQIKWPIYGGVSHYERVDTWNPGAEIYITAERTWFNSTHVHEYGHHFVVTTAESPEADYCNDGGYADEYLGPIRIGCGHKPGCPENANVAFTEGFPEWLGATVCRSWKYDEPWSSPVGVDFFDDVPICGGEGVPAFYGDAWLTEGAFASLLVDMVSDTYEYDPNFPPYIDDLTVSPHSILATVMIDEPISPWQFVFAYKDRYPEHKELFWQVCGKNGYTHIDTIPPTIGTVTSPSHPIWDPRPATRIALDFTGYADDFSGLAGYAVRVNEGGAVPPSTHMVAFDGSENRVHLDPLDPGTYVVTVRAIDRAGNYAPSFQTVGPLVIREAVPCDIEPEPWTANWAAPLVPTASPVVGETVVPAPSNVLLGDTYWHGCLVNTGEIASPYQTAGVLLDGEQVDSFSGVINAWGDHLTAVNQGPLTIPGGRHTFELAGDFTETVVETSEANNNWARQWIWYPTTLWEDDPNSVATAPVRTAGWDAITDAVKWYNCDGYRIYPSSGSSPSTWAAVWVSAPENNDDVDVRLHGYATSAVSGFGANLATSYRPAGYLDAVLVNRDNHPGVVFDAGVLAGSLEDEPVDFQAGTAFGTVLNPASAHAGTLEIAEGMDLYTFIATPGFNYTVTVERTSAAALGPLRLGWYGHDFGTGGLLDYDAAAIAEGLFMARIDFTAAGTGSAVHAFAVWRDRIETQYGAQNYTITIRQTPSDLAPATPSNWHEPLVPRASSDATDTWAPEPDYLLGELPGTFVNYAVGNATAGTGNLFLVRTDVDGVGSALNYHAALAPGGTAIYRSANPINVRGGRHVLSFVADVTAAVDESDETNNVFGTQYVWRPATMPYGTVFTRSEPPDRTADWDRMLNTDSYWYNCDGLRVPTWTPTGETRHWGAVAVVPEGSGDVDLRLYEISEHPRDGFDETLAASGWSAGQLELVVMNFRNTVPRQFDIGVISGGVLTGDDYVVDNARSFALVTDPDGEVGSWTLTGTQLVHMHEIEFTAAGLYHATLSTSAPDVDLGFSLFAPDVVFGGKNDVKDGTATAWQNTGGEDDSFDFHVSSGEIGRYGLAVWKVGTADIESSTAYTLTITPDAVNDVPSGAAPLATRLAGASPNPFNPRTTLRFELAHSAAVHLRIYDVSGRLVRKLVDGEVIPSGRHETVWNGKDSLGHGVAAGVYFCRFEAGNYVETRRMSLIK